MFRNQYDSDVTVWSPQGRIHQVEYAMEAVKLGTATVGLKNETDAVLVALKRASSNLASYQKKIIPIHDYLGVSMSGITADARMLCRYMRQECLNYNFGRSEEYPPERLITKVANKMQICTQRYDRRPYGVGLLVASYDDKQGPNIFEICPSARYISCKAMSIGSRSQSAKTYLEKHIAEILVCDEKQLVEHGIRALKDTLPSEVTLNERNISIAIVGKGKKFEILSEEDNKKYLANIGGLNQSGDVPPPGPPPAGPELEMDPGLPDPQVMVATEQREI